MQANILEPYELLNDRVQQLRNLKSALQVLRKAQRFLTLSAKLRQQDHLLRGDSVNKNAVPDLSQSPSLPGSRDGKEAGASAMRGTMGQEYVKASESLSQILQLLSKNEALQQVRIVLSSSPLSLSFIFFNFYFILNLREST